MTFRQSTDLPGEAVSLRQALFLATGAGITIAGVWLIIEMYRPNGITPIEGILIGLFVILFGQIAFGFSIATWGFLIRLRGERFNIMRTLAERDTSDSPGSTAIVMPIYNEDPARIFRGLENMLVSLRATGHGNSFDLYILSDSNQPENWIDEECAWASLCSRLQIHGRVFYRKRRVSLHGKSGNIADFCRRWGKRYLYLVILDADSIMAGETLVRLARAMDANPTVGLIQTAPQIVRGTSFFQRLTQFSTHTIGPLFASGSNFWHLAGANYWGHNAIIRLQPFMEHCVLPELPGRTADERHILSHDTVEAALMQQAGYQVWFAYDEPGSYEEGPPNMSESLKRDRRWAQGNLQHFWFLLAPKTQFTNRIHMFFGLMAYLTAPLLVVFIALTCFDYYWKEKHAMFADRLTDPAWTGTWHTGILLLSITLLLLFGAKVLAVIHTLPRAKKFGGVAAMVVSSFLELIMSMLLAPILLYFHTKFVVLTLLGLRVSWKTQNRSDSRIPLGQAIREYGVLPLIGAAVLATTLIWAPTLALWLSPILAGWLLAIPLVMITSSDDVGDWLLRRRLLLIPEESDPPPVLQDLDEIPPALIRPGTASEKPHQGLAQVILTPWANAVHIALLRRSKARAHHTAALDDVTHRLLVSGPESIDRRERIALLWNADALASLHRRIWQTSDEELHPWWRAAMHSCTQISIERPAD